MKTFKTNFTIAAGIIVAFLAILSQPLKAENLEEADEKESKAETFNQQELKAIEQELLQDYFLNQPIMEEVIEEKSIRVYNTEGRLIFEGLEKDSLNMINKSSFLGEYADEKIFILP